MVSGMFNGFFLVLYHVFSPCFVYVDIVVDSIVSFTPLCIGAEGLPVAQRVGAALHLPVAEFVSHQSILVIRANILLMAEILHQLIGSCSHYL